MPNEKPAPYGRTDWAKLRALPDDEIERIAASDPDNPPNMDWSRLQGLDAALARGLAEAEAGRVIPLDKAFGRLRTELELPEEGPSHER